MVKPNAEIYHHLIQSFGIEPEETLFIDDRQDNIEQAQKLGFHGIRFTNPMKLQEKIQNLGLLLRASFSS